MPNDPAVRHTRRTMHPLRPHRPLPEFHLFFEDSARPRLTGIATFLAVLLAAGVALIIHGLL
jgi:hypothetical protein